MDSRECDCMGEGCWRCKGMGTLPPLPPETTETVTFVRVALCAACGVRHPWTPERGWGCPLAVAPQDTVGGLAERLREAQTVAFLEARRRRHAERLARASSAALARVTAERDALRGALVALVTADAAMGAALTDQRTEEWTSAVERLDEAWARALDVLARTGGV